MKCKIIAMTILLLIVGIIGIEPILCETLAEPPSNFGEPDAGTEENPFLIANLANLRWLSETQEAWGKGIRDGHTWIMEELVYLNQTADINAIETINWNDGAGFSPIGIGQSWEYVTIPFFGVYNGNNFAIFNLSIDKLPIFNRVSGLFGYISHSYISGVRVENVNINSRSSAGAIVGTAERSKILNCSSSGKVMGMSFNVGGLIGEGTDVQIENCYSKATVLGGSDHQQAIGGIIGIMSNDNRCDNYVKNCFFYGHITYGDGGAVAGGIAGYVSNAEISFTFVASNDFLGHIQGLAGSLYDGTIFSYSFWDVETTGVSNPYFIDNSSMVFKNFGLTTEEMRQAATYINNDWDFENIWTIDPNVNNGYPFLRNMPEPVLSEYGNTIVPLVRSVVYPNPVRGDEVTFKLSSVVGNAFMRSVGDTANTEISIYNIRGQLIKKSNDFQTRDGENIFVWNRKNENNQEVASGVYFYRIYTPQTNTKDSMNASVLTGKFLILK